MVSKEKLKNQNIAVIGTGLAGSVLTRRMLDCGYNVTVIDKSRGTGGRHAGSRIGHNSADLGAPYFDTISPSFRTWLSAQPELVSWQPLITDFDGNTSENQTFYTAIPRQSALTRSLIAGATFLSSTRVTAISPETQGVTVRDAAGNPIGRFDKVIVATPAPQAAPLLKANASFAGKAASVQTLTAWMLIVTLKQPSGLKADVLKGPHPILARTVKDSAKPARTTNKCAEIWSVEASPDWSALYKDSDPTTVSKALLKAFQALTNVPLDVEETRIHRWLYARHRSNISSTHLWSHTTGIGVCGDWLSGSDTMTGTNSESAWRSANALADQIIASDGMQSTNN